MLRVREWTYHTSVGMFAIIDHDGQFLARFEDEALDSYATPEQAAEDLAGGHTITPSCGDTARLGIPDDLSEWTDTSSASRPDIAR